MKLLKFSAKKIYGRFDFNIKFNDGISLLTGINGCGKTTALKAMYALLSPDVDWMAKTQFDKLKLEFQHEDIKKSILITKSDGMVTITYDDGPNNCEPFSINVKSFLRRTEYDEDILDQLEFFEEELEFHPEGNPIISRIKQLPTPMFLDLHRIAPRSRRRQNRNTHMMLTRSDHMESKKTDISDAMRLVRDAIRDMETEHSKLTSQLREKLILASFDKSQDRRPITRVFAKEFAEQISQYRKNIIPALKTIGISQHDLKTNVSPFFQALVSDAKLVRKHGIKDLNIGEDTNSKGIDALTRLIGNLPKLETFEKFENLITKYNKSKKSVFEKKPLYSYSRIFFERFREIRHY